MICYDEYYDTYITMSIFYFFFNVFSSVLVLIENCGMRAPNEFECPYATVYMHICLNVILHT